MKLSDIVPSVFTDGDDPDVQITTKKYSEFPKVEGAGIEGVGLKDGQNVRFELTTDAIKVNPAPFRNSKGQFVGTPEELAGLENQRDVNNFLYEAINDIEGGDIDLEGYATEEWVADQIGAIPETDLSDCVSKTGGDSMEGPLNLTAQPGTGSRDTRRVNTLGVYSNSSSSALQLGTATTKVYVGENDTSFNGPIKVSEITDRGNGIKIEAPLKFGQQEELMKIETDSGTTQNINLFGGNTNGEATTLKFNILGATWRNAIEFESGNSQGRETVLRIDSNKGLKARNLSMDNTRINSLADPTNEDDAVNLRTVDGKIDAIEIPSLEGYATEEYVDGADQQLQGEIEQIALALEALLTAKTAGQWVFDGTVESGPPRTPGTFKALADMSATENRLALHMEDANGITHAFGDAEVGDYIEVVDMDDPKVYALYVLTEEPPISGTLVELPVKLKDRGADFEIGDSCTIRHFAVNQEDINLSELDDRYLKLTGGTLTGTLTAPKLETKTENGPATMIVEGYKGNTDVAARLTMSNRWNANANGALTFHGLNASAWFQLNKDLDMSSNGLHSVTRIRLVGNKVIQEDNTTRIELDGRVSLPRIGDNKAGFKVSGRTSEGLNANLLNAYHNPAGTYDEVNYRGLQAEGSDNLATCKYVDDKVGSGGGSSFTPGDQVAKTDGESANVGGFWVSNGALYCKVN